MIVTGSSRPIIFEPFALWRIFSHSDFKAGISGTVDQADEII
jgi:hypothetical protein